MLLIYPPLAKPCEAPAGIAQLAGSLLGHGLTSCTLLDANLEGQLHLLSQQPLTDDTWTRRAYRAIDDNLKRMRSPEIYTNPARYQRAVADINRLLEQVGVKQELVLNLANYQDPSVSPLKSADLLRCGADPEHNIFYPWFAERLSRILENTNPQMVGLSLNYLSQAPTTFAMIGFLKKIAPELPIVTGGGLITSWLRNPAWNNPFAGLIDHLVAGPGEEPLLKLLGIEDNGQHQTPDFQDLHQQEYLAPGFILPYAASSGCYWNRCSFCPEKAEENPYHSLSADRVVEDLATLCRKTEPAIIHFLDNAIAPALMRRLTETPPAASWYGFARVSPLLTDPEFCRRLRQSGCLMLKLGIESGDQGVLDAMDKGIDLQMVAQTLSALEQAGIATYVYLLFGTPSEGLAQARKTLDFVVKHQKAITFLNLAVFNMPVCSPEAQDLHTQDFYEGDLSLYSDFVHPQGWGRKAIRTFLDKEFKRHPAIIPILQRDPPIFTSNHAPFML
ncbi:MAG: radical SAM protein [Proteobacteria bacterium]|nr:radical SAM protein [Pseudomonadota bacterium]MBU1647892.1 radical SAM protein [Pseudomonadota bacterium]MBU1986846.1 radical SAM protein [Pseudomonadota bacterium]